MRGKSGAALFVHAVCWWGREVGWLAACLSRDDECLCLTDLTARSPACLKARSPKRRFSSHGCLMASFGKKSCSVFINNVVSF